MKIGSKIRAAREDLEMSQEEVSSMIPMNQSSYSKIERDLQEPSLMQLKMICRILKLNPLYLLELGEFEFCDEVDMKFAAEVKKIYKKLYK